MAVTSIILLVILGAVVVLILWVVATYNALVSLRNELDNSWAQIDVQLRRRYDLIPNLVETVKGYASHERETFEKVTEARNMAMGAQGPAQAAAAENMLSGTLKSLFAVAEAYPELKANQNFMMLQEELSSTENKVSFARQFFNDRTMVYNTRVQQFPANVIASSFNFAKRDFFEVKENEVREAPKVKF